MPEARDMEPPKSHPPDPWAAIGTIPDRYRPLRSRCAAAWPAAGATHAVLQLLLGPANSAFSGHCLLGILDPADELVAGQRGDVLPGIECRGVGDQCLAEVCRKLVHHPTGHSRVAHTNTVAGRGNPITTQAACTSVDYPSRSMSQEGPTTSAPSASARCRNPRSAVTSVTGSAASEMTLMSMSSPLPAAWTTSTPASTPASTPSRALPSRTTTTGSASRPELRAARTSSTNVRAAPGRSRHHPVGRDPTTLAASMSSTAAV